MRSCGHALNGMILPCTMHHRSFKWADFSKTEEFLANTAICYQGRLIAIWCLSEEMDLDILASKIIHEMFHAYQMECGESRFPEEVEALLKCFQRF